MASTPRNGSAAPLLGAVRIRRAHRLLLTLVVALLVLSTTVHHLAPEHGPMLPIGGELPSMPMHHGDVAGHHGMAQGDGSAAMQLDHAMPAMAMCLGVLGAAFLLAYVGAVLRTPRARRRRAAASRTRPSVGRRPGRADCRDGPPTFLRLQVLRT